MYILLLNTTVPIYRAGKTEQNKTIQIIKKREKKIKNKRIRIKINKEGDNIEIVIVVVIIIDTHRYNNSSLSKKSEWSQSNKGSK